MHRRILIVEDEGLIALDLQDTIERCGYSVTEIADCFSEAVAAAERSKPDVVLMDIRIQGPKNGFETAAWIQRQFSIPVIFVSAHSDTHTIEQAKATGACGFILKPFSRATLRLQIEKALAAGAWPKL